MKPPLPELLPEDPLPLLETWLAEATAAARNATAMTLATGLGAQPRSPASQNTMLHCFLNAILHSRDILPGNHTANDGIFKCEPSPSLLGFKANLDMAILTAATTLTDELAFTFRALSNRFSVCHLRSGNIGIHLKFPPQPINQDFEV